MGLGSCGHLGPSEPGELAGDGRHDHVLGALAGGEAAEAAAQAQLGCPGAGDHLWVQALLAAGDLGADTWPVLVDQADSTSWARRWMLPALVRWPWAVRWPLESSLGPARRTP